MKGSVKKKEIRFAEMFCGIGGFRLGLEGTNGHLGTKQSREEGRHQKAQGISSDIRRTDGNGRQKHSVYRCVWANDNDKYANQIYKKNFGNKELVEGDIREIQAKTIPDHQLLTAGFPCQAFSVAGHRKGLAESRGTLFTHIVRVARAKRPPLLLLENVKGILSSDNGRTFAIILRALANLGYLLEWQVLNSKHFGVPQNRQRVFIIGHLGAKGGRQIFPIREPSKIYVQDVPRGEVASCLDANYWRGARRQRQFITEVEGREDLPHIVADRTRTLAGKGRNLESPKPITNALSSVQKDNLVVQPFPLRFQNRNQKNFGEVSMTVDPSNSTGILQNARIRRLTPTECERLQGFPDDWTKGISDTQRYKVLGNAVTVNVIEYLGELLRRCICEEKISNPPEIPSV